MQSMVLVKNSPPRKPIRVSKRSWYCTVAQQAGGKLVVAWVWMSCNVAMGHGGSLLLIALMVFSWRRQFLYFVAFVDDVKVFLGWSAFGKGRVFRKLEHGLLDYRGCNC